MNSDTISLPIGQYDSEETMHESSVIQHFTELGIEQGERKGVLGSLLDVLESRFQPARCMR